MKRKLVSVFSASRRIYWVGQKSKLLILSEFVNKTENTGGT